VRFTQFYDPATLTLDNEAIAPEGKDYFYTGAIAQNASRYIRENPARTPFFLYTAFTAPRWPMHALEADIARHVPLRTRTGELVRQGNRPAARRRAAALLGARRGPRSAGWRLEAGFPLPRPMGALPSAGHRRRLERVRLGVTIGQCFREGRRFMSLPGYPLCRRQ
jgi:hypothetical protein